MLLPEPISITALSSISALGGDTDAILTSYQDKSPLFRKMNDRWVSQLSSESDTAIQSLRKSNTAYKQLDRSVIMAMYVAKQAMHQASITQGRIGVNIGSSRGATSLFESYFEQFQERGKVSPFTSPTTTLGNISSWVAQDLGIDGITIDHSVTCSTAMHSILNGIAWLQANMADAFLVGGSEAALTPFTVAQMGALKLYSSSENVRACESMRFEKKKNSMVLGEGAAVALLERGISDRSLALISGIGFASEVLTHPSSLSENAECFQMSMQRALDDAQLKTVDVVIMHAPGTVKGDMAEKNAIDKLFGKQLPLLTSNKWLLGHTLGASGMFSVEMAVMMLQENEFFENPFYANRRHLPKQLETIMINAVGFGGNAVSIILRRP